MVKQRGKDVDMGIGTATIADGPFDSTVTGFTRIETMTNNVSITIDTTTVDSSAYGQDFDSAEVITYKWSVDLDLYYQIGTSPDTESLFMNAVLALAKYPFVLWLSGKPAGEGSATQPRYSGRVIIASASPAPARAGLTMLKVRLQGDGALFRAVT